MRAQMIISKNKDLQIAIEAARRAGKILQDNFNTKYRIVRKSVREMVSEIDIQSQQEILKVLKDYNSKYQIISEEKSLSIQNDGKVWIIDPIDGTHNYIAGLPFSGISIALACKSTKLILTV